MNVARFVLYYLKLHLKTRIGVSRTAYPLNLRWRWANWQRRRPVRRAAAPGVLKRDIQNLWHKLFR